MAQEAPPDTAPSYPDVGETVNGKYQVTRRIGAGSFGAICEVINTDDGKIYAVKFEVINTPAPQLQYEYKVYQLLDAAVAVPRVYDFWIEETWRCMVMDRLGPSLGYFTRRCGKILSLKSTLMCGIQMICRMEYLHQRSFIHRDIKPDNFVFGVGQNQHLLYTIDLGLAKKYRDLQTHQHVNYSEDRGLAGTARYVSLNVHLGVEQSRRDDLESVGYVLIGLVKGVLPWQGMEQLQGEDKYEKISESKIETPLDVLCEGIPQEFMLYMERVRNLRFDERPAYEVLRALFVNLMVKMDFCFDWKYDWVVTRAQRLDAILRGRSDRFVMQLKPEDVEEDGKGPVPAIPFKGIMQRTARYVQQSREGAEKKADSGAESKSIREKFAAGGNMFLLDPRFTKAPCAGDLERE